jgi:hypothetical protein
MMTRTLVSLFVAGLLIAAISAGAQVPSADSGGSRLTVAQDESSQEKIIERNLVDVHKLVVDEKVSTDDKNDMYLELPFKGDPMPKFRVTIDTQSLNTDKDSGKIIERGVLLNLYTGVNVPADKRAAVLEKVNDVNRRKAFSSIYIDTDGEIVCCWILNILPDGLPVEYVYDATARIQNIWKELYKQAAPDLGLPQ